MQGGPEEAWEPASSGALLRVLSHALHTHYAPDSTRAHVFDLGGSTMVVVTTGDCTVSPPPLVRVHSRCLYGEVLGSLDCDCLAQLALAWKRIADEGRGALVYLDQEGRGLGLLNKAHSYMLTERDHLDTVEAYQRLHLPVDAREYVDAAFALHSLGVHAIRLMTNNPSKVAALQRCGITVRREPHRTTPTVWNREYLLTKQEKLGHDLDIGEAE